GGMGGMGGMGGPLCGNGVLDSGEACDDGNEQIGDGCNATCQFDAVCGNGKKESGEACDDGNMTAGDGCGAACKLEMGSLCANAIDLQNLMLVTKDGEITTYNGTTVGSTLVNFSDPSCSVGTTGVATVLHRYRTVPTLSRLIAKTLPIGGALQDPVLWMFSDCVSHTMETACNDDSGSGRHPKLRSPVLSPATDVTFVLAGHNMTDVGPYRLVLTEQSLAPLANAGTCAMPNQVNNGHYLVTTAGTGAQQGTCTGAGAPEAVLSLALNQLADVRLTVTPEASTLDVGVYMRVFPCSNGSELGCAEAGASGEPETLSLRDVSAGNYAIFVDGFTSQDAGLVQVDVEVKPIVAVGMPCDLTQRDNRCVTNASCVGPAGASTCKTHTVLFSENFNMDLGGMSVVDIFSDGNGWGYCDPVLGCTQDNTTESLSGGGFALIKDKANALLDGEILRTSAVNTAGYATVLLGFDHDFDHWDAATDLARVEVSKDGVIWTQVTAYTLDGLGSVLLNVSAVCANSSCRARFVYDDQTAGGDSFAEEWRIDDVRILGVP
ncbi:MAG TPA: DUF4215 domain-containing protein, partial [Polyangium sp.]|nr:DUF4215 domain-containing protein [Polyangium sp.]